MTSSSTPSALIFSKTAGYRHGSISTGISAITDKLTSKGLLNTTASEDASIFTASALSHYNIVILLHTSGDFLTDDQLGALQEYMRSGGGVFAIHGAAAGVPSSDWYGNLIGAHFDMHPDPESGAVFVADPAHPIIAAQTPPKNWMDEWYNFKSHPSDNSNLQILLRGDTTNFTGGKHGDDHPLAWCQKFEGGRSAYIALGHFDEAYGDEWFMGMMERGVLWAARRDERARSLTPS